MKKIYIFFILILIVAASQAINAENEVILNRNGEIKIADYFSFGADLTKTITCSSSPDSVDLYNLSNPISVPIRVLIWSNVTSEFFLNPGYYEIFPGDSAVCNLAHSGVPPGTYSLPVSMSIGDNDWEMLMRGVITINVVEVLTYENADNT